MTPARKVTLLSLIFLTSLQAEPIKKKKSLRLTGETKAQMIKRLLENEKKMDVFERRKSARKLQKKSAAPAQFNQCTQCACCEVKPCCNFKLFEGFWQLDSIDDYEAETLIEFFVDNCGQPFARFYDGTQNNPRERTPNDFAFEQNPVSIVGTVIPVEILGPRSLRLFNNGPVLSTEDLTSTFRIQDDDDNTAYAMFWSLWDGTGDDPRFGVITDLTRFVHLPERPDIQLNRIRSLATDWTNPVEMFNYIAEYWELMANPQKLQSVAQVSFIGWPQYEQLKQTILTTGITRTAQVSDAFRGGNYIGVWRTQYPDDFPVTTIHTKEFHHMTPGSIVNITGFKGAYVDLNGPHTVAAFPTSTISESNPFPWVDPKSWQHYLHIIYDSSSIEEAYDPNIHGTAQLVSHHGPITPTMGYSEFIATCLDFLVTSFGSGTHNRMFAWVNEDGISMPETFEQLQEGLAEDRLALVQIRTRTVTANSFQMYWNPGVFLTLASPAFNINDPFGLGLAPFVEPRFNFDITISNYLDESTIKNIFFTVTGPINPEQPITSLLVDRGYTSNGSKVVYTVNNFRTFPEPLVDEFGTHPWMIYNNASSTSETGVDDFAAYGFFGGIIKPELTNGKTVAYLRVQSEDGIDFPFYDLVMRSITFGQEGITAKYLSNFLAAWSTLIADLNKHQPDRFIIDIRNNNGGMELSQAWGTLFGGDRIGAYTSALVAPGNSYSEPTIIPGSSIQTVFDSIPKTIPVLPAEETARTYPNGVVRSNDKKIEVIILDSTRSASSGDIFPHSFLSDDPNTTVHNLGHNVEARIIGDIDGRLYSSFKALDPLPINNGAHNLADSTGFEVTATYLVSDAGRLVSDVNGYIVNPSPATRPNVLLPSWYDNTEWQDIGLTPVIEPYPLGSLKPLPSFENQSTWRDIFLEHAIVN